MNLSFLLGSCLGQLNIKCLLIRPGVPSSLTNFRPHSWHDFTNVRSVGVVGLRDTGDEFVDDVNDGSSEPQSESDATLVEVV
jgi:hypothetical protein